MAKNRDQITVYPAYAGVILFANFTRTYKVSLSRIRGGDPQDEYFPLTKSMFIPHTRGWSCTTRSQLMSFYVYPAYAGVIQDQFLLAHLKQGLSRIRGGDPKKYETQLVNPKFIPHTRGWSQQG